MEHRGNVASAEIYIQKKKRKVYFEKCNWSASCCTSVVSSFVVTCLARYMAVRLLSLVRTYLSLLICDGVSRRRRAQERNYPESQVYHSSRVMYSVGKVLSVLERSFLVYMYFMYYKVIDNTSKLKADPAPLLHHGLKTYKPTTNDVRTKKAGPVGWVRRLPARLAFLFCKEGRQHVAARVWLLGNVIERESVRPRLDGERKIARRLSTNGGHDLRSTALAAALTYC